MTPAPSPAPTANSSTGRRRPRTSVAVGLTLALLWSLLATSPATAHHGDSHDGGVQEADVPIPSAAATAGDVDGFTITTTHDNGLVRPTIVREAPDGAIFVAEKSGSIKVYEPGSNIPTIVGNLAARANDDLGLLGFALHPSFPTTPAAYVLMAATDAGDLRVGRLLKLTFAGDARTITGTDILVNNWCGTYDFHGPNHLEFGPDGALYATAGDYFDWQDGDTSTVCGDPTGLEGGYRSQDYQDSPSDGVGDALALTGAIARFELTASGDLSANTDIAHEQVIGYGLRDAVRFAFSPDGTLFFTDDGIYTEEINVLESPSHPSTFGEPINYGWPCYEGAGFRRPEAGKYAETANLGPCLPDGGSPSLDLSDDRNGLPVHQYSGHGNRIMAISFLPDDAETYGSWANALLYADWGNETLSIVPFRGGHDFFWESAEVIARNIKIDHIEVADDGSVRWTGLVRDESDALLPQVGLLEYTAPAEKPGRFTLDEPWLLTNDTGGPIPAPTTFEYVPTPGDDRIFVATKTGQVWVYENWGDASGKLVVDLTTLLTPGGDPVDFGDVGDAGLLSMALHPNFVDEPWIYLLYTDGTGTDGAGGAGRLQRFSYDPDADPADVVLDEIVGDIDTGDPNDVHHYWCLATTAHPVTDVNFAPDGTLYVTSGEGASAEAPDNGELPEEFYSYDCNDPENEGGAFRSQDIKTTGDPLGYNGTLIRLNPDGSIPADNPLVTLTPSYPDDDAIIAHGLRTPWRFAIHPYTSEIFISQVGWDTSESIFHIEDPLDDTVENFGWPCYEGDQQQPRFAELNSPICTDLYANAETDWTPPLLPYSLPGGQSASGLRVYLGGAGYPQEYEGALFYSDYAGNFIKAIPAVDGPGGTTFDTEDIRDIITGEPIVPIDMKIGGDGKVTYLDIFGATLNKVIYSQAPGVRLESDVTAGTLGTTFNLTATSLFDTEGVDVITWDLDRDGDYSDATGPTASLTPTEDGVYFVRVIATDPSGGIGSAEIQLNVGNTPPELTFNQPTSGATASLDDEISYEVTATDADAAGTVTQLDGERIDVEFVLFHCSAADGDGLEEDCHEHYVADIAGSSTGTFTPAPHSLPSRWVLRATAREPDRVDWNQTDYGQRRTVRFDNDIWLGDSDSFVAPIVIHGTDSGVYDDAIVVDAEGNPLPVLVEEANQMRTIWVRFPAEVEGEVFTIYYDRSSAAPCEPDCGDQDIYEGATGLIAVVDGNELDEEGARSGLKTTVDLYDPSVAPVTGSTYPSLSTSPWGNGMSFDAAEFQMVKTSLSPSQLDGTTGYTWTLWVQPASVPSFAEGLDAILVTDNGGYDWGIVRQGPYWSVFNGAGQTTFDEGAATPLPVAWEEWQMLTLTIDPATDEMRFYFNDTAATTITMTADNYTPFSGQLTLANAAGTNGDGTPWSMWFSGDIDNVRIYDRPLSANEVANLYQAYKPTAEDVAGYQIAGLVDVGPVEQPSGLSTTSDFTVEPVVATYGIEAATPAGAALTVPVSVFAESLDTPFDLDTMKGTDLSLTVPASSGQRTFRRWDITYVGGTSTESTDNPIFLNTREDIETMVAVYATDAELDGDDGDDEPQAPVCARPDITDDRLEDQVKRLYRAFFLRDPDSEGLAYWKRTRAGGISVSAIAAEFAASAEFNNRYGWLTNGEYVLLIYRNVLGREPDATGAHYWRTLLESGVSRGAVMTEFSESPENISRTGGEDVRDSASSSIVRLYIATLQRRPDTSGLNYWTSVRRSGVPLENIATELVSSGEFLARYGNLTNAEFVAQVYCTVLGRQADAGGASYWVSQLNQGVTRGAVMVGFSESREFVIATDTLP